MLPEDFSPYRETKTHGRQGFAYNTYLCTIPLDFMRVRAHWHDEMEFIYIKKGAGCVTVDRVAYPVGAGSIVIVAPGRLHAIDGAANSRMEYENIIFSPEILDTPESDWCREAVVRPLCEGRLALPVLLTAGDALYAGVSAALDAADAATAKAAPGYPLLVKSALFRLLYLLYGADTGLADTPAADTGTARLKGVLSYIEAHYAEHITVADAAAAAHYSTAHFMRFFRAGTGQSFIEYLNDHRLAAAARLLQQHAQPVSEIAQACGFDSASYFCRRFGEKYGMSPRAWREKQTG